MWLLGQSGALSLWGTVSQTHGIDGVVMRDGDVREQTPIESGSSQRATGEWWGPSSPSLGGLDRRDGACGVGA